jgi:peptidoglycan/xylan/chitin deacetylase (PgdA/CDA1 family)
MKDRLGRTFPESWEPKAPISFRHVSDLLVLCYHAVSPTWPADLSITPRRLEEQLDGLVRRGYRGATFTEAVTAAPHSKVLAVTFDDAYRSVLELALPILERLGLPGTVFAPTDFVGTDRPMSWPGIDRWLGGPHEQELVPMSWQELGGLAAAGWEIGSHTAAHPMLTQVHDDAALARELGDSKAVLEDRLGRPCESIAYPYGDHDDRVVEATHRAGYRAAGTLPKRLTGEGPLRCPRVGVYYGDGARRFRMKVSPLARRLRASGAWTAADRLRSALHRSSA